MRPATPPRPVAAHRPLIIAHRGASAAAPENTLLAAEAAVAQRADLLECDVQRSADGHLVLCHDADLRRTTDVAVVFPDRAQAPVEAFTLAELRRLDAGGWHGRDHVGAGVATLGELVVLVGPRIGLLIELKNPARHPGIEAQLLAALAAGRPVGPVVLQSFDHTSMRRLAALGAPHPLGLLVEDRPDAATLRDAAGWAHQVNPAAEVVDAALVQDTHAHGLTLHPYTVNTAARMRELAAFGVDGIITDVPPLLHAVLDAAPIARGGARLPAG